MGTTRRFLNLIVSTGLPGVRSLCRIDLTNQKFFERPTGTTTIRELATRTPAAHGGVPKNNTLAVDTAAMALAAFEIPDPTFGFKAEGPSGQWDKNFFPLADRKVMSADMDGRAILFDADAHTVVTLPGLHRSKLRPFSLYIPGANRLYVMDGAPVSEVGPRAKESVQFEAFTYSKPTVTASESGQWQLLPPPLFVRDPTFHRRGCFKIESYAVLEGDSRICISESDAGTYCMDIESNTWERVGNWTLPFYGKVEYVPELNLWFGFSGHGDGDKRRCIDLSDHRLAAADLSAMCSQSQPQLVFEWQEFDPPNDWYVSREAQLVNLGSGRFCIARFYHTGLYEEEDSFVVFTGLEFTREGKFLDSSKGSENVKNSLTTFQSQLFQSTVPIYAIF